MRFTESFALLALVALPAVAAAQHTKAAPGRVAGIAPAPPPPPPPQSGYGNGYGYGHESRGTVIVRPNGTVIVTPRRGYGERARNCAAVQNGYGSAYVQPSYPAYPAPQSGVTQPTIYQPQPGVAQPMPYTPPVPNQQTASQQMADNPQGQSQRAGCW